MKYNPDTTVTNDEISDLGDYALSERISNLMCELRGYATDPAASAALRESFEGWEADRLENPTRYRFCVRKIVRECKTLERAVAEAWLEWRMHRDPYCASCGMAMEDRFYHQILDYILECPKCGGRVVKQ